MVGEQSTMSICQLDLLGSLKRCIGTTIIVIETTLCETILWIPPDLFVVLKSNDLILPLIDIACYKAANIT